MASPENKLLQAWIAPVLKATGYTKESATWRRSRPPFIHVLNIQGSQWSRSFYFNLGIYITDLGSLNRPKEYECHVRQRLDSLVPERKRFLQLCDFEQDLSEEQRGTELRRIITVYAVPWLDQMSSLDHLRQYILREKAHGLPVTVETYEYLGTPNE
jgi:hypothetical protein